MHEPVTLVVGDANADLSAALQRFPFEGDDAPIAALTWSGGGTAVNCAVALARLGAPPHLLARVGADPAADVALRAARSAGVGCDMVQIDPALATGLCFVAVSPGGERTFFSYRGANVALAHPAADPFAGVGWLHICGHALIEGAQRATALALAEVAARRSLPISLDMCLPLIRAHAPTLPELLQRVDLLFANEIELAALAPAMPEKLAIAHLAAQSHMVAAKLGARGCIVAAGSNLHHMPAFAVDAVDATGCGDAFVAGFIYARRCGWPVEQCATLAIAIGALTATRHGAADVLPTRAEAAHFLRAAGRHELAEKLLQA
jgi:sugar/nucleoside kinase (ribokinase family)